MKLLIGTMSGELTFVLYVLASTINENYTKEICVKLLVLLRTSCSLVADS